MSYIWKALNLYGEEWAVIESISLHFLPQFDLESQKLIKDMIQKHLKLSLKFKPLGVWKDLEIIQNYYVQLGNLKEVKNSGEFVLTESFTNLLQILASAVSCT